MTNWPKRIRVLRKAMGEDFRRRNRKTFDRRHEPSWVRGDDLSQELFAKEVGASVSSVRNWEMGRTEPHPLFADQIAKLERKVR